DKPYPISPTGYHIMSSPFWGDQYIFFYIYFALGALVVFIYAVLSYAFNSRSIILLRRKETTNINEAKTFKDSWSLSEYFRLINYKKATIMIKQAVIISITIYVGILVIKTYPIDYNQFYNHFSQSVKEFALVEVENTNFTESKEKVVEAVENKTNYADFTKEEKYGYVMRHPDNIIDDLDELGFIDKEDHTQNSYVYKPQNNEFYIEIPYEDKARSMYPDYKYDIYIYIYDTGFGIHFNGIDAPSYGGSPYLYSVRHKEEIANYTKEEKILYQDVVDTVYGLIDHLFAMEMRNQNMEEPKFLSSLSFIQV
ncbi:MAG: hypothetical protein ACK5NF_05995, partial [Bacilli bacterium]